MSLVDLVTKFCLVIKYAIISLPNTLTAIIVNPNTWIGFLAISIVLFIFYLINNTYLLLSLDEETDHIPLKVSPLYVWFPDVFIIREPLF